MELTQFVIPLFVALEVVLILALYRYVLRDWIIQKWEEKMMEEGWLVLRLEPVIDEIEDRMHDKLEHFQNSFFGSVGQMTKKAKELDPMNNIRKAAKSGDWTSMMVEYMANKANLSHLIAPQQDSDAIKEGQINAKPPLQPQKLKDFLNK